MPNEKYNISYTKINVKREIMIPKMKNTGKDRAKWRAADGKITLNQTIKYMPTGTVNKKRSGPSGPPHHYRESHAAFFTIFLSVKTLRNTPRKTLLSFLT